MHSLVFYSFLFLSSLLDSNDAEIFAVSGLSWGQDFFIKLEDPQRIKEARAIVAGNETLTIHIMGRIKKAQASYNTNWNFHLDPRTISFFEVAIEVCDASARYVNDHLDEACGAFLPGCYWCPWNSVVRREEKSKR